ncbi:ABC transporter permease [Streptomyces sp. NPDC051976]|uniref:ABC transporter permease n=1 Tax=Streptomyces sp. NPDC051976 TaxID=3154947 RepID=UPI003416E41E
MTGFVLLRVRAHRLLLTAALLTVLLTTSVLATFTAFTSAIGDAALRRTLQHQAADQATVEVTANVAGLDRKGLDSAVRRTVGGAFAGLPSTVVSSTRSGPYGLPLALRPAGTSKSTDPDLTLLATFDRARVTLVGGAWPGAAAAGGTGPVDVAVPEAVAQALKLHPGTALTLTDRLGGKPLHIRVSGVYKPVDRTTPYWHLDPLDGRGIHTVAFTTYGPMLADPGTFASGRVTAAAMSWQATGDFATATAGRITALETGVRQTIGNLRDDAATSATQASSGLPALLEGLRRSMLVTRSTLLISALQLVILAGFALLLVAQLLAEERAGETALLRARGGSRVRVARLAAGEAVLLALPAVLVAPLLAGPVTRMLAGTGAMARTGVSLGDGSAAAAWLVSLCAALACAFAVIVPALRTSGSYAAQRAARSRRGALPGPLQAGADLGLLLIAGVAYWQLQRRASGSGALSTTSSGGLGVDPVLVAAPALCLLAGTVLVLRLLPLAARLAERRAAGGRGLALALAGWQLARRPRRGAGAVLLLVLAVAMGMFAIGQGASWDRSQRDQADFTVGADIRVTGMTTPPFAQAGIFSHVPGITAAAPATRSQLLLTQQRNATALVIDTKAAASSMRFRSDLTGGRSVADVLAPLHGGAKGSAAAPTTTSGFAMPGDTATVAFTATLRATAPGGGALPHTDIPDVADHLSATLVDGLGVDYDFSLGDLPPDGAPHVLTLDLASSLGSAGGAPSGPLRLVRIDTVFTVPGQAESRVLSLSDARITGTDGKVTPLGRAAGQSWNSDVAFDDPSLSDLPSNVAPGAFDPHTDGPALFSLTYRTGKIEYAPNSYQQPPTVTVHSRAPHPDAPTLTAVATDDYLRAVGAKVGSSVQITLNGVDAPVRIVGSVHAMPGTVDQDTAVPDTSDTSGAQGGASATDGGDRNVGGMLLDLRAVNQLLESQDATPLQPTEWWVATKPGSTAQVAATLRARNDIDTLLVRDESAAELRADPLGAGPQSALPAAVIAAAVLAAVGFAVSSAGAIRERNAEFAVLRALGAPRRKLARMIAAEQGLLVLISLLVGVALGALLTRLVTPLIVLTAQAAQPVPTLLVRLPAGPLVELLAVVLAAPLLVVLATAIRRGDPASALRRQGED